MFLVQQPCPPKQAHHHFCLQPLLSLAWFAGAAFLWGGEGHFSFGFYVASRIISLQ